MATLAEYITERGWQPDRSKVHVRGKRTSEWSRDTVWEKNERRRKIYDALLVEWAEQSPASMERGVYSSVENEELTEDQKERLRLMGWY